MITHSTSVTLVQPAAAGDADNLIDVTPRYNVVGGFRLNNVLGALRVVVTGGVGGSDCESDDEC